MLSTEIWYWVYALTVLISFGLALTRRQLYFMGMRSVLIFVALAFLASLLQSATYALGEIALERNLNILFQNLINAIVAGFAGIAGVTILAILGEVPDMSVTNWKPKAEVVKEILLVAATYNLVAILVYMDTPVWIGWGHWSRIIGAAFAYVSASAAEELMFRVFLYSLFLSSMARLKRGWIVAGILTSLAWTISHNMELASFGDRLILIFPLGMYLTYVFRTRGFMAALSTHICVNLLYIIVYSIIGKRL